MGRRGPLKTVSPLRPVDSAFAGTAATAVSPIAPGKPKSIAADSELSEVWDEVVPQLDRAGILSSADIMTVELAIRHFVAARHAYDELIAGGSSVKYNPDEEDGVVKRNPAELVFRLESDAYMRYAKELGMTFVSRARTAMKDDGDSGRNPFAATGS